MATPALRGLGDTALDGLRIKGQKLSARILEAVLDAEIERTIDGASTLTLRVMDERRELLRKDVFAERATTKLDELLFETVAFNKSGPELAITFESGGVAALRRKRGPRMAKKGTTTRTQFARQLVHDVRWLSFRGEEGDPARVALGVGTDGNKSETYWDALKRLADDRAWRCFESEETIYFGSDAWLQGLRDPFVLSEDDEGVDWIDLDYDGGKKASSATVTCWASRWASRPGEPVRLRGMGALGSGIWITQTIRRSLFSQQTTVTLTRKTPELPEPTEASLAGGGGILGGIGAPAPGVFAYCPVPGGRVNDDFGAPRVGHTHQGNDIFAPSGTSIIAVFDGTLDTFDSGICGKGFHIRGAHGYVLGCHLSSFARAGGSIRAGELIGYVGNTGNAATTPPHLHFEWHPGGGSAIDPHALLMAVCGG